MKEILYRGKRADNGEWLLSINLIQEYHYGIKKVYFPKGIGVSEFFEIIPETLGQYTGLLDKNGEKIFEGDIVKCSHEKTDNIALAVIKYGRYIDVDILDVNDYLGWYLEIDKNCISILSPENDGIEMEVIGNIHDNPELLEVSK